MERQQAKLRPHKILGVAAHPDDLDFVAAGSMAQWAADGADVSYLILTDGGQGTSDREMSASRLIERRREEQRAAGKVLGIKEVLFLDFPDGGLENSLDLRRNVVRAIRRLRPDMVVTMDPSELYAAGRGIINHPDHRAAGQAVLDAVYPFARDHLAFPELLAEGLEPYKVQTVLLDNFERQNFAVDISDSLDKKLLALQAHESQMPDFGQTKAMVTRWAEQTGREFGYRYAEGFMRIDVR